MMCNFKEIYSSGYRLICPQLCQFLSKINLLLHYANDLLWFVAKTVTDVIFKPPADWHQSVPGPAVVFNPVTRPC